MDAAVTRGRIESTKERIDLILEEISEFVKTEESAVDQEREELDSEDEDYEAKDASLDVRCDIWDDWVEALGFIEEASADLANLVGTLKRIEENIVSTKDA